MKPLALITVLYSLYFGEFGFSDLFQEVTLTRLFVYSRRSIFDKGKANTEAWSEMQRLSPSRKSHITVLCKMAPYPSRMNFLAVWGINQTMPRYLSIEILRLDRSAHDQARGFSLHR